MTLVHFINEDESQVVKNYPIKEKAFKKETEVKSFVNLLKESYNVTHIFC